MREPFIFTHEPDGSLRQFVREETISRDFGVVAYSERKRLAYVAYRKWLHRLALGLAVAAAFAIIAAMLVGLKPGHVRYQQRQQNLGHERGAAAESVIGQRSAFAGLPEEGRKQK